MGKKYKVVYEKGGCIGAFACVAVMPELWEVGTDGKAILLQSPKEGPEGTFTIEIDEKDLQKMKEAAESCPVNVIHIYDEHDKKII